MADPPNKKSVSVPSYRGVRFTGAVPAQQPPPTISALPQPQGPTLTSPANPPSRAGTMCHSSCARSLLGRIWLIRAANSGDSGATSRLGRKTRAQDLGLGEPARRSGPFTCGNVRGLLRPRGRFSPKPRRCAETRPELVPINRISPKPGRCAANPCPPPPANASLPSRNNVEKDGGRGHHTSWARLRASRHRQDGRVRLSLPMRAASTSC